MRIQIRWRKGKRCEPAQTKYRGKSSQTIITIPSPSPKTPKSHERSARLSAAPEDADALAVELPVLVAVAKLDRVVTATVAAIDEVEDDETSVTLEVELLLACEVVEVVETRRFCWEEVFG